MVDPSREVRRREEEQPTTVKSKGRNREGVVRDSLRVTKRAARSHREPREISALMRFLLEGGLTNVQKQHTW